MIDIFNSWFKRKFSEPNAAVLLGVLSLCLLVLVFLGEILAPVIVAIVIAYLLDWPVNQLNRFGVGRTYGTGLVLLLFVTLSVIMFVLLVPVIWQQGVNFAKELPQIWTATQDWIMTLPEKYPQFIDAKQIGVMLEGVNQHLVTAGERLLTASFSSLLNLVALLVYLILVPLMVFFMLKDKTLLMQQLFNKLPKERRLIRQVGDEMNRQIINYIRGKVVEILIVGTVSVVTFVLMDLRYAVLLGVLVGLSVLVPYIGAAVVTVPVAAVALFQWGVSPEFWYLIIAYGIIQALDGNLLVPLLFSEAVSLHPLYIIVAVLFFGGLWGFWGVFFAIPLATLVKAVMNAWSESAELLTEERAV